MIDAAYIYFDVTYLHIFYANRMNYDEKIDLIIQLFDWQKAYDRHCENKCFLLNFGYKKHLPFPQIEMSLDQDPIDFVNIGNYGNIFSSECSFVVIGG